MTNLTVRDVSLEIALALEVRAAANGRSAEAEHRMILREALAPPQVRAEDFTAAAARLRARLRHNGNSVDLVRAARNGSSASEGRARRTAPSPKPRSR